jgi:transglutaminase-like putative cysteine protease
MPGFNQTADIEYAAGEWESTDTPEGPRELLRIATRITLGQNNLEQTIWTDRQGQTIKTHMPALQQLSYRTTQEKALAKGTGTFDLGEKSIVKVDRRLEQPHKSRRVVYRATVASGDPANLFARSATQLVKPLDERTVEISVRALRPQDELGTEFPRDPPPVPEDLQPNSLIQSDDEQIVQLAGEVATKESTPWEIAVALERRVREMIDDKNFSQALSSAAEVVRSREGDCTEHAVLLAALCRARKIPARVAIGLVYFQPSDPDLRSGFAYHMWTDAWIQDRWVPLDATMGLGGIGAAHLLISRSNLKGVDPLTQFLPVLQLIGNLQLEIVSSE